MNTIEECAIIGGTAATPYIKDGEIPGTYSQELIDKRAQQVARAMERGENDIRYDISEAIKVGPVELARGGYTKVQKTLSKLIKENRANILKTSLSDEWKEWLMSGSSKEAGEECSPRCLRLGDGDPHQPHDHPLRLGFSFKF